MTNADKVKRKHFAGVRQESDTQLDDWNRRAEGRRRTEQTLGLTPASALAKALRAEVCKASGPKWAEPDGENPSMAVGQ